MEMIYYTIAALLLYGVSDYILNTIEIKLEKRLPNRSLIFFAIISILAVASFSIIQAIYPKSAAVQTSDNAPVQQPIPASQTTSSTPANNVTPVAQAKDLQSAEHPQLEPIQTQPATLPVTQEAIEE
jgi:predicted PurR-regulated permease PerM